MIQYNPLNANLPNSHLNNLESEIKDGPKVNLNFYQT